MQEEIKEEPVSIEKFIGCIKSHLKFKNNSSLNYAEQQDLVLLLLKNSYKLYVSGFCHFGTINPFSTISSLYNG